MEPVARYGGVVKRKGSVSVTVNGVQETSAGNTLVPNRVNVRATITSAYLYYYSNTNIDDYKVLRITYSFERQVDGEWGKYPTLITTPITPWHRLRLRI